MLGDITKKICGYCNGQGKYSTIGEESCMPCCGTGQINGWVVVTDGPCTNCNGTGKKVVLKMVSCNVCQGNGYVNN